MYACIYWPDCEIMFHIGILQKASATTSTLRHIICLNCLNPDADGFKLWEPFELTRGQKGVVHWNGTGGVVAKHRHLRSLG